ncbi:MAG: exodeoxyribonuclease VII small subunit [Bacteroidaceae bacterium]|nr:exodeoxyribonuclease VII small subunit [Bacteroidaceae bacterium]
MQEELTYEQAMAKLEALAQQMEHDEVPIDQMATRLREAQQLIVFCRDRLYAADKAVQEFLAQ